MGLSLAWKQTLHMYIMTLKTRNKIVILLPIYVHYFNVEYCCMGLTCTVSVCARLWDLGLRIVSAGNRPGAEKTSSFARHRFSNRGTATHKCTGQQIHNRKLYTVPPKHTIIQERSRHQCIIDEHSDA